MAHADASLATTNSPMRAAQAPTPRPVGEWKNSGVHSHQPQAHAADEKGSIRAAAFQAKELAFLEKQAEADEPAPLPSSRLLQSLVQASPSPSPDAVYQVCLNTCEYMQVIWAHTRHVRCHGARCDQAVLSSIPRNRGWVANGCTRLLCGAQCLRAFVLVQKLFVRVLLRQDTVCDDGGPGAFFVARCALGTDCADCGGRTMPPPPPRPPLDPGSYLREDGVVLLIDASPSPSPEAANPLCRNTCQYSQVGSPVPWREHAATTPPRIRAEVMHDGVWQCATGCDLR